MNNLLLRSKESHLQVLCDNMWIAYWTSSMHITFLRGNKKELVAWRLKCGKVGLIENYLFFLLRRLDRFNNCFQALWNLLNWSWWPAVCSVFTDDEKQEEGLNYIMERVNVFMVNGNHGWPMKFLKTFCH